MTADGGFLLLGNSNGFPESGGSLQGIGVRADADWNTLSAQSYGPNSGNGYFAGMAALGGKFFAVGDVVDGTGATAWIMMFKASPDFASTPRAPHPGWR